MLSRIHWGSLACRLGWRRAELPCDCSLQGQQKGHPGVILTPTVFVLGAGASADYDFPDGKKLAADIATMILDRGPGFHVMRAFFNEEDLVNFALHLRQQAPSATVDDLLRRSKRQQWREIARVAIPAALIPHEDSAKLDTCPTERHWLTYLFERMLAGGPDDFAKNKLSVITFNFDRVFEIALTRSLRFGCPDMTDDEIRDAVLSVPVLHVHGQLGECAWLSERPGRGRRFEPTLTSDTVAACRDDIRIVGEEIPTHRRDTALSMFADAKRVVFIGFSFEPNNTQWLINAGMVRNNLGRERYATAYRLAQGESAVARAKGEIQPDRLGSVDQDAMKFIRHHDFLFDVP